MIRFGIIGLPQAGKTTIFNALTGQNQSTVRHSGRLDIHLAVVDVPDPRVDRLVQLFDPRKITHAKVTYADITGLDGDAAKGEISGALLSQLSQMEGFVHVVRCFENPTVSHPNGDIDPLRDLASLNAEMLLNDLIVVERRIERIEKERGRGKGWNDSTLVTENELMLKLQHTLGDDVPLRDLDLDPAERKMITGFGFLSLKPMLILFNTSEGQTTPCVDYIGGHCEVVALQGKLEMDIAQLPVEERSLFMNEYGIMETGLKRVINQSYCLMDIQTFFTVGEDEVRAWTIPVGASALEAAGAIHTDLQKGFIRAEVIDNESLVALGSLAEARKKGKLRLEGKEYMVKDGDIVHVRFNI